MKNETVTLTRLTGSIYRSTQVHTNEVLKRFQLGSGTYPYLLALYHNDGINQNQISKELDVDKAMSARMIKNLINLGYVTKVSDQEDSRAYKLYLTEQARSIIPDIMSELNQWNEIITKGLNPQEKQELVRILQIVLQDMKNYRNQQKVEG